MRIVIGGGGKVGEFLCQELSNANHDVLIIDQDEGILQDLIDRMDISGIVGNIASYETLAEADAGSADMFIAVTDQDEINMIGALLAKHMGADHTTVRVRDPIYRNRNGVLSSSLGLDLIINPEHDAAVHIADLIRNPHALNVETFSRNRVTLIELHIDPGSHLDGLRLMDFRQRYGNILVTVIQRGDQIIVPQGSDSLKVGDNFFIVGEKSAISNFYHQVGRAEKAIHSVLILGGGYITYELADMLAGSGREITIMEVEPERARELSESLPGARILLGDGTNQEFLEEARIGSYDCMVALTGIDEENIMASLYGLHRGVRKIITKVNRTNILRLLTNQGLDAIVTPKFLVANRILKKVRSVESSRSSNVEDVYRIADNKAEALMFTVTDQSVARDIPLKDLNTRNNTIVACIIRDNRIFYPGGFDTIKTGDQVLIVTSSKQYDDIDDILEDAR